MQQMIALVNAGQCMFSTVPDIVVWDLGRYNPDDPSHIQAIFQQEPPFRFRVRTPEEILPKDGTIPKDAVRGDPHRTSVSHVAETFDIKEVYIPLVQFCRKCNYQRRDFISGRQNVDTPAYTRFVDTLKEKFCGQHPLGPASGPRPGS